MVQKDQSKISAVIIVMNEEANIARCLQSLAGFVDEVILFDSGSTDRTLAIATDLGVSQKINVKIIQGTWEGFGPTKFKATQAARQDWIFSIDADEVATVELKLEIAELIQTADPKTGYLIPRRSFFLNRWIDHGGWYPDFQLRFFNRRFSNWSQDSIHEVVQSEKKVFLKKNLLHYVFKNISHQVITNDRYSTLQAAKMFNSGKRFNWFHFLTKPYVKFIECYFWKCGFIDGWPGFIIAYSASYSVFLKWSKLYELQDLKEGGSK